MKWERNKLAKGLYHRVAESLWLEGTTGDYLMQVPVQTNVSNRAMSIWVLSISNNGDSSASLGSMFLLIILTVKISLCLSAISCIPTHAHCLLPWEKPGPISFIPTIKYLSPLIRCPWAISSPGWPVPALSVSPDITQTFFLHQVTFFISVCFRECMHITVAGGISLDGWFWCWTFKGRKMLDRLLKAEISPKALQN